MKWLPLAGHAYPRADGTAVSMMNIQMLQCPSCAAAFDTFGAFEHHLRAAHRSAPRRHRNRCVTCDAEFLKAVNWL